jgi:hypothetical protein
LLIFEHPRIDHLPVGTCSALFVFVQVIILTNLLIAMMSDTYNKVNEQSTDEWRVLFATRVREYWNGTELPLPFNMVCHHLLVILNVTAYYGDWSALPRLSWRSTM